MRSSCHVARAARPRVRRFVPIALGLVLALILAPTAAVAQVALPTSGQVTPNVFNPAGGTLLASLAQPFTNPAFTGSLRAAVVRNELNTLDFYYQITNDPNSLTAIGRESNFDFTGFTSSVFYRTDNAAGLGGFVVGAETPDTADRDAGGVVGFNFNQGTAGSGKIDPGETSSIVVIRTNATLFAPGLSSIINGGQVTLATFMPVIPEPATTSAVALMLTGLLRRSTRRRGA